MELNQTKLITPEMVVWLQAGCVIILTLDRACWAGKEERLVVRLSPGGRLTVAYDSVVLFDNLPIPGLAGVAGASFGWGARTGADNDNIWIKNVSLTTNPQILNFSPIAGPPGVCFSFYGVLQSATKVGGPYTDLPQATSPYKFTFPAGAAQMFWRARAP
jgi:hypothetical protein